MQIKIKKTKKNRLILVLAILITVLGILPFIVIQSYKIRIRADVYEYEEEYNKLKNENKIIFIRSADKKMPFYLREKDRSNKPLISEYIKHFESDTIQYYLINAQRLPLFCEGQIVDTLIPNSLYVVNIYNKCAWNKKTVLLHSSYIYKDEGVYKGATIDCRDFNRIFNYK